MMINYNKMKNSLFISSLVLVLTFNTLSGQNIVEYSYDVNGNRIERTLFITQLKSAVIDFPVDSTNLDLRNPHDLNNSIHIYPNPFRSTLHISITGYDNATKRSVFVYGISGIVYFRNEKAGNPSEVDLGSLGEGIYILRIIIDNEILDYKIMKSR
jgi:hypothetical protein